MIIITTKCSTFLEVCNHLFRHILQWHKVIWKKVFLSPAEQRTHRSYESLVTEDTNTWYTEYLRVIFP